MYPTLTLYRWFDFNIVMLIFIPEFSKTAEKRRCFKSNCEVRLRGSLVGSLNIGWYYSCSRWFWLLVGWFFGWLCNNWLQLQSFPKCLAKAWAVRLWGIGEMVVRKPSLASITGAAPIWTTSCHTLDKGATVLYVRKLAQPRLIRANCKPGQFLIGELRRTGEPGKIPILLKGQQRELVETITWLKRA